MNVDVNTVIDRPPTTRTDGPASSATWRAAVRLALVVSVVAALVAVAASAIGVPHAAVVLPVIVVAFALSWVKTARPIA